MTYNLFPGLKQILEDKRIKRFGVPPEYLTDYLRAEQFVLDERNLTSKEILDVNETYFELKEYGLGAPPLDYFVIHAIRRLPLDLPNDSIVGKERPELVGKFSGTELVDSTFWYFHNGGITYSPLCKNEYEAQKVYEFYSLPKYAKEAENDQAWMVGIKNKLIVYLATKGIIKEHHGAKTSQQPIDGKPHKKGSGGYTLVRPPEAHEVGDGTGTHASPRPHFRRGHIRKFDPEDKTKWVWVSPCFVNGEPEAARKAYLVKERP